MDELARKKLRKQQYFYSGVGALLILGILLATNFIFSYIPIRLDTSEGRVYSISEGSKNLMKELDDTILVKVVFSSKLPAPYNLNEQYVRDLLLEYKRASGGKVRIEYLDPEKSKKDREDAQRAGVAPVQIDERSRSKRQLREVFMGISIYYGDKRETIPFIQDTQAVEYEITQRIKKLIDPEKPKLGIITSGKALTLDSEELERLKQPIEELFVIENIDLAEGELTPDISAVWFLGPAEEIPEEQAAKIGDWVKSGGTLGLLLDGRDVTLNQFRTSKKTSGLEPVMREWGIGLKEGLVVDPQSDRIQIQTQRGAFQMINVIDYPYMPLVLDIDRTHPATKNLSNFSMPFVSPIERIHEKPGLEYTSIARSSEYSYLDPFPDNVSPLTKKPKGQGFMDGPFDLAVIVEGVFNPEDTATTGRVVLFGTSRFIRSDFPPRQNNFGLFLNMLDWSVQDEVLLSIRSKGAVFKPMKQLSDGIRGLLKYTIILFLPIISIVIGLIIWRRQKVRRQLLPLQFKEV